MISAYLEVIINPKLKLQGRWACAFNCGPIASSTCTRLEQPVLVSQAAVAVVNSAWKLVKSDRSWLWFAWSIYQCVRFSIFLWNYHNQPVFLFAYHFYGESRFHSKVYNACHERTRFWEWRPYSRVQALLSTAKCYPTLVVIRMVLYVSIPNWYCLL